MQKHHRFLPALLWVLALVSCRMPHPASRAASPDAFPAPPPHHPRLYLTADTLAGLQTAVHTTHAHLWSFVKRWTDARLNHPEPAALTGDFRRVGELIPYAALCYLVTGDPAYRDLAARYMTGIAKQEPWGDDIDIEAAHLLYGLAVGYDWLHAALTPEELDLIERKLIVQARRMRPRAARRYPPLNNHRTVNLCSLGTAALVLLGKTPEADEWLAHVEAALRETLGHFGSDGYWSEGLTYWSYTTEYLLKYLTAIPGARHPLLDHPWLQAAALSPIHHALPFDSWTANNLFLNLADSPRFCWYGPHYQLFCLASLYGVPGAQWLGDRIARTEFTREHADWLSLLWYDPTLPANPAPAPSLTHQYEDWGVVVMRGGDTNQTLCAFTCGPAGSGHSHPDANSFAIFSSGAWLAAAPGATLVKRTSYHNTVLVNGLGQQGEGRRWLQWQTRKNHSAPRIVLAHSTPDTSYFVGDASRVYRRAAGLTRFQRHFHFQRPDRITIVDELAARRPSRFDWLLHTPADIEIVDAQHALVRAGDAAMSIEILEPEGALVTTETVTVEAQFPDDDWRRLNRLIVSPPRPARHARFVMVLHIRTP